MKTLFLTNEYPPTIYGGAGVSFERFSILLCFRQHLSQIDVHNRGVFAIIEIAGLGRRIRPLVKLPKL